MGGESLSGLARVSGQPTRLSRTNPHGHCDPSDEMAVTHQSLELGCGQRPGEQVALPCIAALIAQECQLRRALDAFGDGLQAKAVRQADDRRNDCFGIGSCRSDEALPRNHSG